jgi:hypothetical protein
MFKCCVVAHYVKHKIATILLLKITVIVKGINTTLHLIYLEIKICKRCGIYTCYES